MGGSCSATTLAFEVTRDVLTMRAIDIEATSSTAWSFADGTVRRDSGRAPGARGRQNADMNPSPPAETAS